MNQILTAIALVLLIAFLAACNATTPLVNNDIQAFVTLTEKYGTPGDQACANIILTTWQRTQEVANEPVPNIALLADAYKFILLNRIGRAAQVAGEQNCGQFAAEVLIMIGRTANRVRP